jgi:hypothetical protein
MRAVGGVILILALGGAASLPARAADVAPAAAAPSTANRLKALGEMPPDSEPAAQAAWRIRRYDLQIEIDRSQAEHNARAAETERQVLDHFKATDAPEADRLRVLRSLDNDLSLQSLIELHARAADMAKAAVADAEAVRLAVAVGRRPAADLAAAQAKAAQAQRLVQAAQQAHSDKIAAMMRDAPLPVTPIAHAPVGTPRGDILAAQERARLEGVAYSEVREAVEAGRRPPSDLEAAREALKAAQTVVWDQLDALRKTTLALSEKLHADALRHVEEQQIRIAAEEKELETLSPDARLRAEDRLRMSRERLESYKHTMLTVRAPFPQRRPDLPVLPPRT